MGVSSRGLVPFGFVVSSAIPIIGRVRDAGAGRPGRGVASRQLCLLPVSWTPNLPVKAEQTYTITELAREFAITSRAIRFYEDQGLLQPARVGRARVYSRADRTRLKLTLRGRRLGLSLAEIRELIDMYDGVHNSVPQLQRLRKVLAERRASLEQQREDIVAVLAEIDMLERQCSGLLGNDAEGAAAARAELDKRMLGNA